MCAWADKSMWLQNCRKMDLNSTINVVFLCLLNAIFMVAGIVSNYVVITSLWRSPQLRKKPCYFMILVLSCLDELAVAIVHPILISSTISWSMRTFPQELMTTWKYTSILLGASSMFALLTLTIERFLSVRFPIFHRTSITRKQLVLLLTFLTMTVVAMSPLLYFQAKVLGYILVLVFVLFFLFAFVFLNYKMLSVIKSKQRHGNVNETSTATPSHQERKTYKINFKNVSTCSLAVGCFLICSSPQIVYSAWRFISKISSNDRQAILFNLWCSTFFFMNSTFNCLIFFWKNSILRREGMKMFKCF